MSASYSFFTRVNLLASENVLLKQNLDLSDDLEDSLLDNLVNLNYSGDDGSILSGSTAKKLAKNIYSKVAEKLLIQNQQNIFKNQECKIFIYTYCICNKNVFFNVYELKTIFTTESRIRK